MSRLILLTAVLISACAKRHYNSQESSANHTPNRSNLSSITSASDLKNRRWSEKNIQELMKHGLTKKELEELSSPPPFDYELPAETGGLDASFDFAKKLSEVASQSDETTMSLADFLTLLPTTKEEDSTIMAARSEPVSVKCDKYRHCVAYQFGNELKISLSEAKIPVIGSPSLALEKEIKMQFQIIEAENFLAKSITIELCAIEGISVKKGWVYLALDGVKSQLTEQKLTKKRLGQTTIDVGPMGTYPNSDCALKI